MSEVEPVDRQIEKLSAADLAESRAWFLKSDVKAGKLQDLELNRDHSHERE